jgi:cytoskeletal protein RodZ
MIATTIYQHSLDRTRDTVKARIKLPGGRTVDVAGKVEVPAPRVAAAGETGRARVYVMPTGSADQPTAVLSAVSPASPARPRRRWLVRTALTVGVFLIGLLAVTGVELLKGSTLARGETGTSVGRVVDPRPVSADTTKSSETAEPTETTETSTSESTETAEPTASEESNSDAERGADATTGAPENSPSSDAGNLDATSPVTPAPTRAPSGG